MLLALDAADRLARRLATHGELALSEAASELLALASPGAHAARLLARALAGDARFDVQDGAVRLAAAPAATVPLEQARFLVVDLETSALSPVRGQIVEAACVVLECGMLAGEREVLVRVGRGDAAAAAILEQVRDSPIAGHNVRFDIAFLDAAAGRLYGARLASPVVDTMTLARRLLEGRAACCSLAALAVFFGTATRPRHRALPDARTTAEVLLRLVEFAAERGARTVADLCALSRPLARQHQGTVLRSGRYA